jgi:putative transposase
MLFQNLTVIMKKHTFSESQIVKALKENEGGRSVGDISRELGIDKSTFYYWRKKYGGMESGELKRLKELEQENQRLKQMYADVSLDNKMLKDLLSKKF